MLSTKMIVAVYAKNAITYLINKERIMSTITRESLMQHWQKIKKERLAELEKKNKSYSEDLQKEDRIQYLEHIFDKVENHGKTK